MSDPRRAGEVLAGLRDARRPPVARRLRHRASPRCPTSSACPSTRSRSTARSSWAWPTTTTTRRSCARRSTSPATSASRSSPRASRRSRSYRRPHRPALRRRPGLPLQPPAAGGLAASPAGCRRATPERWCPRRAATLDASDEPTRRSPPTATGRCWSAAPSAAHQDGEEIDVGRRTVALCRCGKSQLRPFCDGTHQVVGSRRRAAPRAAATTRRPRRPPLAAQAGPRPRRAARAATSRRLPRRSAGARPSAPRASTSARAPQSTSAASSGSCRARPAGEVDGRDVLVDGVGLDVLVEEVRRPRARRSRGAAGALP